MTRLQLRIAEPFPTYAKYKAAAEVRGDEPLDEATWDQFKGDAQIMQSLFGSDFSRSHAPTGADVGPQKPIQVTLWYGGKSQHSARTESDGLTYHIFPDLP